MYGYREDYNSPAYKSWRFSVFKRDRYCCALCFRKGIELNAHHIVKYATAPHLRHVTSNGITLCKDCHENRVNGREEEYERQFKEIVAQKKIQSINTRAERTGKRKKEKPKYRPRNPNVRW